MSTITKPKIIGSLALAFVVAVGIFGTAKAAQAFFLSAGPTIIFDGIVGTVGTNSFTAYTTSTSPVTVDTNKHSIIQGGSLAPGEDVKILASRRNGVLVAQIVNVENGVSGYGTSGTTVLISNGVFVSKGSGTFVVSSNGVDVTFHVNSATRFFNTSLAQLTPGERLVVIGQDTGSSSTGFIAQDVFR